MYAIYDTFNNFIALKSNMLGGGLHLITARIISIQKYAVTDTETEWCDATLPARYSITAAM